MKKRKAVAIRVLAFIIIGLLAVVVVGTLVVRALGITEAIIPEKRGIFSLSTAEVNDCLMQCTMKCGVDNSKCSCKIERDGKNYYKNCAKLEECEFGKECRFKTGGACSGGETWDEKTADCVSVATGPKSASAQKKDAVYSYTSPQIQDVSHTYDITTTTAPSDGKVSFDVEKEGGTVTCSDKTEGRYWLDVEGKKCEMLEDLGKIGPGCDLVVEVSEVTTESWVPKIEPVCPTVVVTVYTECPNYKTGRIAETWPNTDKPEGRIACSKGCRAYCEETQNACCHKYGVTIACDCYPK